MFLTLIEGFMEVELMVTKRDDDNRQPSEYRAICLEKVGRKSFAILTKLSPLRPSRQGTSFSICFLNGPTPLRNVFVFIHLAFVHFSSFGRPSQHPVANMNGGYLHSPLPGCGINCLGTTKHPLQEGIL